MPGRVKSAPYWARPVTFGTPSGRTGLVPTTFSSLFRGMILTVVTISHESVPPHFDPGGIEHRLDDLVVARAAAQVAREPVAHFFLGRIGVALEQRLAPRRAPPACRCRTEARRARGTSAATGAACRRCAMPSIVWIDLPCASAPSIRHEHISRPSTVTLHAPQSPVAQPSLVPVRCSSSRRTSSSVWCVSQRNSTSLPLSVAVT